MVVVPIFGHATAPAPAGAYDCIRHLHIRQNYTTVWVTTDGRVVDAHRHFMQGAGHSEHGLFVKTLLTPGASAAIPRGPNMSRKKRRPATPKRSAKLKRMLSAPEGEGASDSQQRTVDVELPEDCAKELLPGMVAKAGAMPILDASGQEKEALCLATTHQGRRCKRSRTHGNFCARHYEMASSQKHICELYDTIKAPAEHAMSDWEKSQIDLAIQLSQAESQGLQEQQEQSYRLLDERCRLRGLRRIPVDPYGNCQFEALVHAAQVPLSPSQLRFAVVQYLRPLGALFGDRMESCFAGRYQAYCDNLLKDGVWGDDLTLLAGAHILRRPIVIITDSASDNYAREICPPHIINRSLWGQNIFVTCNLDRHFDATEAVLGGDPAARSHRVEQFTALWGL